jgi:hypothetical protein
MSDERDGPRERVRKVIRDAINEQVERYTAELANGADA